MSNFCILNAMYVYLFKTDEANWTMAPIRLKLQEAGIITLFS